MSATSQLTDWIRTACLLEATAKKPGNVHPGASFADLSFDDFVKSARITAPILANAKDVGVGETIFRAVAATREQVGTNTNLGMLLLIAPLAAVPCEKTLVTGIASVLEGLTREDAAWVYRAIRLSQAGGLGEVPTGDVAVEPAGTLREMMQLAASRDWIAAEYASGFSITLEFAVPFLKEFPHFSECWEAAVIELQLRLMASFPDTLIARKCGPAIAEESALRAQNVLDVWPMESSRALAQLQKFDRWLRADGHRRNPGTTADLIAASLFAALREGHLAAVNPAG